MFSDEYIDKYLTNQILKMESCFLRKSNVIRYALYRYKKNCVFCLRPKMLKETKEAMRRHRLKEIVKECLEKTYKEKIPTATYMKF